MATMKLGHCLLLVCWNILLQNVQCGKFPIPKVDWFGDGRARLTAAVTRELTAHKARNVVLFVGDGMGLSTVMAARVYKGQRAGRPGEEESLNFEDFHNVALSKVYSVSHQVPDSAATATAILSGVKANVATIGLNDNVGSEDCDKVKGNEVTNIVRWSQLAGKKTGVVTNMRITHATPAAAYAHTPYREWEAEVGENAAEKWEKGCTDIAYQLVHGQTGKDLNVLFGGGRAYFVPANQSDPHEPGSNGVRPDGRNLIQDWLDLKRNTGRKGKMLYSLAEMANFTKSNEYSSTDYLLGLFARSHMAFELDRDPEVEPSLAEMTEVAINAMQDDDDGFFLLVEGGRIDYGHHFNSPKRAITDTLAMEDAVQKALNMTDADETLIIVTADHSHSFTVAGAYPTRGNDILGIVDEHSTYYNVPLDNKTYTTLSYVNGPGGIRFLENPERPNLTNADTTADNYEFPAQVPMRADTHSGEDVAIYATGPMAHLFHGVVEQNYIAHVMAYASCVGEYSSCEWFDQVTTTPPCANKAHRGTEGHWLLVFIVFTICSFQRINCLT